MKKVIQIVLLILYFNCSFADGWIGERKKCVGPLKKYHAYAEIAYRPQEARYNNQTFIGYQTQNSWKYDKSSSKTCNNCAQATRYRSTLYQNVYYQNNSWHLSVPDSKTINASAETSWGGCYKYIKWFTDGNFMKAGCIGTENNENLETLDDNPGFSKGNIENFSIDFIENSTTVNISNINGYLEIQNGSDYTSEMKVIIYYDPTGIVEEGTTHILNSGLPILFQSDIILNGGVVSTNNVLDQSSITSNINGNTFRVDISNLNITANLPEGTDMDNIIVIVYGHGGASKVPNGGAMNKIQPKTILENGDDISIYPNPSNGCFEIQLPSETPCNLELYDTNGKVVYSDRHENSKNIIVAQNSLIKGVYLLRLKTPTRTYTRKIVRN